MYDGYVSEASKDAFTAEEYIVRTTKVYEDLSITDVQITFTKPDEATNIKLRINQNFLFK